MTGRAICAPCDVTKCHFVRRKRSKGWSFPILCGVHWQGERKMLITTINHCSSIFFTRQDLWVTFNYTDAEDMSRKCIFLKLLQEDKSQFKDDVDASSRKAKKATEGEVQRCFLSEETLKSAWISIWRDQPCWSKGGVMRREGRVNCECCEKTLQRPPGGGTSAVVGRSWGRNSGGSLEAN